MAKMLKCGDVNAGCDTVLYGRDTDEVMAHAEDHMRHDHNMTLIPPSVVSGIIDRITEAAEIPHHWWDFLSRGRRAG